MITGTVTEDRVIVIPLEVIASDQSPIGLEAVVDTGFNGYLTLPSETLKRLKASSVGTRRAELGDGKIVELDVSLVKIKWQEAEREVLALQAEATPLVGMSLLWGNRVTLDAQKNGTITIEAIP